MLYHILFQNSIRALQIYMAEPVDDVIAVTFTAILFRFQFKKAMNGLAQQEGDKT